MSTKNKGRISAPFNHRDQRSLAYVGQHAFTSFLVLAFFLLGGRQCDGQHLFNRTYEVYGHAVQLFRSQVFIHVHAVFRREDDVLHAGSLGCQEFLLYAANRQNVAAQRYLAGHSRQRTHWTIAQQ